MNSFGALEFTSNIATENVATSCRKHPSSRAFHAKIAKPGSAANTTRLLSKSSLKRNDSMPDLILSPIPVRPCTKCGAAERYACGRCKTCAKAAANAKRIDHPEAVKADKLAYRTVNKEKISAKDSAYRAANKDKSTARRIANKDKINAALTVWRAANPDAVKAMQAAYYAANKERFSKYQADHKEKIQAYRALYCAENPEKFRIYNLNRRASEKATGKLSTGLAKKLYGLQQGKCPCCKQPLGDDYHLDHVIPLARGGVNADSNMQLLRAVCNMNKSAKDPLQFMQSRGFLL